MPTFQFLEASTTHTKEGLIYIVHQELVKKIRRGTTREIAFKMRYARTDNSSSVPQPRFAFFLGAGASVQSGIKLASEMMADFRRRIVDIYDLAGLSPERSDLWFQEHVFNKAEGNEYSQLFEFYEGEPRGRQDYIGSIIKDKDPSFGYAILANLIAQNYLNVILTTNFDDLPFIACAKFSGLRPVIYAYGILATELKVSSLQPKIIKMHGDFLYSRLANTEAEMKAINQDPNMHQQVQSVLSEYELICIGYSGSDDSVMKILEDYPPGKNFYWLHQRASLPNERVLQMLEAKSGTLVPIDGFDECMFEFYKVLGFNFPAALESIERKQEFILSEIRKFESKYASSLLKTLSEDAGHHETSQKQRKNLDAARLHVQGQVAFERGEYNNAEQYFREALGNNSADAETHNLLGLTLDRLGRPFEDIETAFKKAIELDPQSSGAHLNLAHFYSKRKVNTHVTEDLFRKAIELNPRDDTAYSSLGYLIERNEPDRVGEAEALLRKALEINPHNDRARNNLAILLDRADGREREAEDTFLEAVQRNNADAKTRVSYAKFLAKNAERLAEAERELRTALELDPKNAVAFEELGFLYTRIPEKSKIAERILRQILEQRPSDTKIHLKLARLLSRTADSYNEAINHYKRVIEINPFGKRDSVFRTLERIAAQNPSAVEDLEDFLSGLAKSHPKAFLPAFYSARICSLDRGKRDVVLSILSQLIQDFSRVSQGYEFFATFLNDKCGDAEGAERILRALTVNVPSYPRGYVLLARQIALDKNRIEDAEEILINAGELFPGDSSPLAHLARIREGRGDRSGAEEVLAGIIKKWPNWPFGYVSLAYHIACDRSRRSEAEAILRGAVSRFPSNSRLLSNLAFVIGLDSARLDESATLYLETIDLDPNYPKPYNYLGMISHSRGDETNAKAFFEAALSHDEESVTALLALAHITKTAKNKQEYPDLLYRIRLLIEAEAFYDQAGYSALSGDIPGTAEKLNRAVIAEPYRLVWAFRNPCFDAVRNEQTIKSLITPYLAS